jgi:murein DD-endopeptidase MepM/ murein hydrolase activator NlpD
MQEVAELNDIADPTQIKIGQKVFIPGSKRVLTVQPYMKEEGEKEPKIIKSKGRFIWPVNGRVTSRYGIRNGRKHDGVDIAAPLGAIVLAADSGKVIYRGRLRGYGKILILRHNGNFTTVYAHLKDWLVRKDVRVKRGQSIARVGISGRTSGSHLHFEIRHRNRTRNPLFYLK